MGQPRGQDVPIPHFGTVKEHVGHITGRDPEPPPEPNSQPTTWPSPWSR